MSAGRCDGKKISGKRSFTLLTGQAWHRVKGSKRTGYSNKNFPGFGEIPPKDACVKVGQPFVLWKKKNGQKEGSV